MSRISVQDLKARLSSAVAEAEAGATLIITRHNEPVAQLAPVSATHTHRGARVGSSRLRPAIEGGLRGAEGLLMATLLGEPNAGRIADAADGAACLSSLPA